MKPSKEQDYKDIFKQAAEIASAVPEPMQPAAFNRALDLLQGSTSQTTPAPKAGPTGGTAQASSDNWQELIDRTRYPEITGTGTVLMKSLTVLRIARDEFGVDGLSPGVISAVLKDKFRLTISANQVSDKLGAAGNAVDRRKEGKAFIYKLMHDGDVLLSSPTTATPNPTKHKAARTSNSTVDKPNSSAKKTNGRPGPMVLVSGLIDNGFFTKGRKTADVIDHAKKNLGYTYKSTDLSPAFIRLVRNGRLKRDLDGEKQYEYTAS